MDELERRLARLRGAIQDERAQMKWLAEVRWGESTTGPAQPAQGLDGILAQHQRIIEMYEALIADLESRTEAANANGT